MSLYNSTITIKKADGTAVGTFSAIRLDGGFQESPTFEQTMRNRQQCSFNVSQSDCSLRPREGWTVLCGTETWKIQNSQPIFGEWELDCIGA